MVRTALPNGTPRKAAHLFRCGLALLLLAGCGPSAKELDTVCTAYDEAIERLAELGDTVVLNAEARVRADGICEGLSPLPSE